jgi:copper oxidase (laccase) domain-containing protein
LDLAAANVCQALASGVEPARVSRSQWSTRGSSELFFSHRGSAGPTGRFAAGIWLAA